MKEPVKSPFLWGHVRFMIGKWARSRASPSELLDLELEGTFTGIATTTEIWLPLKIGQRLPFCRLEGRGNIFSSCWDFFWPNIRNLWFSDSISGIASALSRKTRKEIQHCMWKGQGQRKIICTWTQGRRDFPSLVPQQGPTITPYLDLNPSGSLSRTSEFLFLLVSHPEERCVMHLLRRQLGIFPQTLTLPMNQDFQHPCTSLYNSFYDRNFLEDPSLSWTSWPLLPAGTWWIMDEFCLARIRVRILGIERPPHTLPC